MITQFHLPSPSCAARPSLLAACIGAALALPAAAQDQNLVDLSIEELANIQVTSVSKRPERLQDAPASVFVITADDLRRSGARSLPEALRLAPNLHVVKVRPIAMRSARAA